MNTSKSMPNTVVEEVFIHVVAAVIWHPQEPLTMLITQRPEDKHLGGYWELPGGKKESSEIPEAALGRELKEEIGIEVIDCFPMMQIKHSYPDKKILLDVWEVSSFAGEAVAMEQQAMAWAKITELASYQFPDADEPVLAELRGRLQGATR